MTTENMAKWDNVYQDGRALIYPDPMATHLVHRHVVTDNKIKNCLSIACGNGNNEFMIARTGLHVTCSDSSTAAIATLKRLAEEMGLASRITAYAAPMDDLSRHADSSFDFVLHWGSLHYERSAKAYKSMAECHRVLRPGGVFIGEVDSVHNTGFRTAVKQVEPGTIFTGPGTVEWREGIEVHPFSQTELETCLKPFAEYQLGHRQSGILGRLDVRQGQWFFLAHK